MPLSCVAANRGGGLKGQAPLSTRAPVGPRLARGQQQPVPFQAESDKSLTHRARGEEMERIFGEADKKKKGPAPINRARPAFGSP